MSEDFEIFDESLKDQLRESLRLADRLKRELLRARQAGIDVSDIEAELANVQNTLKRIQTVYGGSRARPGGVKE